MAYKSIKSPGLSSKMGGTQQRILLASFDDFETIQEPTLNKISTAHTFKTGKGFVELYVTKNTGSLKFEPMGGPDRRSLKATGKFLHPGESDDIDQFFNQCKNDRFIILAPLAGSTELYQIGNNEFQAEIKPSYDTTENEGDGRGNTFEYECYCKDKIKYAGTITMMPTV